MERKLVRESCLRSGRWGLLEMYILLTDDVGEINLVHNRTKKTSLELLRELLSPDVDIKLDYRKHQDLILSLLIARCPVSNNISREIPIIKNLFLFWLEIFYSLKDHGQ